MPFDIADRIRDGLGLSDGSETSFTDVDRPNDVTVERVTADLENAVANGDLVLERTGFDGESDLLAAVDPMVLPYREHHNAINRLNQIQTGWGSNTDDTDSDAVEEDVDDEVVGVIDRHGTTVVSVLKGFGETEPFEWVTSYVNQYPYFACLVEYAFAYGELDERGYLG